jgi:hypothetical protein
VLGRSQAEQLYSDSQEIRCAASLVVEIWTNGSEIRSITTRIFRVKEWMKAKHHFWSSLVTGGALYWATGSVSALAGSMIGGFLIDSDHIIDQMWSIWYGAPFRRAQHDDGNSRPKSPVSWVMNLLRPRKLLRLPLVFHSYELLVLIIIITVLLRTPFFTGLLTGYVLHLSLDMLRHHHEFNSPFFYLISYRLAQGFRRDCLIKREYL